MIALRWAGSAFLLLAPVTLAAQDPAATAWRDGNHTVAEELYAAVLAEDSTDSRALHRLSLLHAWSERYDSALRLIDKMIALYPENIDAQIDRARIRAWRGDLTDAIADLQLVIDDHPSNLRALQAQAQFAGWAGETDRALNAYDQIMELAPDDPSIIRNQAMVLTWAARNDEARLIYDSLLRQNPDDEEVLLAMGRLLSWSGHMDSASAIYRRILGANPDHVGAMQGEARTITWSGALAEGERRWRRTVAVEPDNVVSLVGLAQTLRWQGRPGPALELLHRALRLSPNDRDVLTQLRWTESIVQPRASTAVTLESDSDGNRLFTTVVRTAWRPDPSIQIGADVYRRSAGVSTQPGNTPTSVGLTFSLRGQLEPGWAIHSAVGLSQLNNAAGKTVGSFNLGLSSPGRNRITGTIAFSRSAFDYTRLLIENAVTMAGVDLSGRIRVSPTVSAGAGLGVASFQGSTSNRRFNANANVTRRLHPQWTIGMFARVFGFSRDLTDGYFDPSYYGLFEALTRWNRTLSGLSLQLELAPGMQQVRSATMQPAFRTAARITYTISPGRDLVGQAAYSSAGLQNIATTASEYRYYAMSLAASWLF